MTARAIPTLLILGSLLMLANGWAWRQGMPRWQPPAPLVPEIAGVTPAVAFQEAALVEGILARPLFREDRKGVVRQAASEDIGLGPDARVLGILGAGADTVVVLHSKGKTLRLPLGQTVGGWRVTAVDGDKVRIEGGGRVMELVQQRAH